MLLINHRFFNKYEVSIAWHGYFNIGIILTKERNSEADSATNAKWPHSYILFEKSIPNSHIVLIIVSCLCAKLS